MTETGLGWETKTQEICVILLCRARGGRGGGEDQAIIHYATSRCQQKWAWMSGGHKQKYEKHTLLLRKHSVDDWIKSQWFTSGPCWGKEAHHIFLCHQEVHAKSILWKPFPTLSGGGGSGVPQKVTEQAADPKRSDCHTITITVVFLNQQQQQQQQKTRCAEGRKGGGASTEPDSCN